MTGIQLIGSSSAIRQTLEDAEWAARSEAKVLLTGESGVGKEVVARLIHERSRRCRQPLVAINCAGVPDTLLASELFGHTRGSFTDAYRDKAGWLEQANMGTVFLDEVGEMSLQMQALLLRFLENGEIQRVGGERRPTRVDVRVITATNRQLLERVSAKEFREDLYYRLNVVHIEIPPLRSRRDDVPTLVNHFLKSLSAAHRVPAPEVAGDAMKCLVEYDWPGNVRELKNIAERLVVRGRSGVITVGDLPVELAGQRFPVARGGAERAAGPSRAEVLFERMTTHRESFWSAVHAPFMLRDLTREDLRAVVRGGLVATRGNYKALVQLFNMPNEDYKRFLSFLRKHHAHMPIHEFRAGAGATRPEPRAAGAAARERAHETVGVS